MKDPLNDILNKIESEYQTTSWPTIRYEAKQALNAYYLSLLPDMWSANGKYPHDDVVFGRNQTIDEMKNRIKGAASPQEDSGEKT